MTDANRPGEDGPAAAEPTPPTTPPPAQEPDGSPAAQPVATPVGEPQPSAPSEPAAVPGSPSGTGTGTGTEPAAVPAAAAQPPSPPPPGQAVRPPPAPAAASPRPVAARPPAPRRRTWPRTLIRLVTFLFGILQALLIIRIVLLLLIANPDNELVTAILNITEPFVEPFRGMFQLDEITGAQGSILDVAAVVALIFWTLVEMLIVSLLRLFDRQPSRR